MKVEKYKISELIEQNKRQFIIPVYQRNYDWERANCKKLFDDIVLAYKLDRVHFLGSIVYVDQGEENKIYRHLIIDGQQRITTIFLLLKALLDIAEDEYLKKEITDLLFNIDKYNDLSVNEQTKIKLKPIKSDNEQLVLLMKNDLESINRSSNIFINYDYMKKLISKSSSDGIMPRDILSGIKKLTAAVIILDAKEDEPQVVFESINSTGVELSLADLVRNYVLMADKNQDRLFEEYWVKIENNVGQKKMPSFIIDYLQFACKEKVTLGKAYTSFKNHFENGNFTNETMLSTLLHYSNFYKTFLGNKNNNYSEIVNRKIAGFNALGQSTIYQFLFHIFDDYENGFFSSEVLEKVLTFFLNYLLRRVVCVVGSNSLNGLYKTLYNRIFVDKSNYENYYDSIVQFFMQLNTKDSIPSDSIFKDALLNTDIYNKKIVCKYLLKSIEDSTEDGTASKEMIDVSDMSIEHVMPQKLSTEWQKSLGNDYARIHEKYLHNLGNLTLTGYNSELGQKPFAEKKRMIIEKNSHIVALNKDILSKSNWGENEIKARAERLSSIILRLFYIEKSDKYIPYQIDTTDKRYSLEDDFDPSNTKPNMYILLGMTKKVNTFVELLSRAMENLYDLDNDILNDLARENFQLSESSRTYISYDSEKFRKAVEIYETGIFFESNLSAKNILSFIRKVLDKYEIDYSEFIVFLDTSEQ